MAKKIILHIGLQKSGTTFLQHMVQDNSELLAAAGVRYPVPVEWERGERTVANHEWSSYGLLGTEYPWVSERRAAKASGPWRAVLDQVRDWPGTVLLSAEALSTIRSAGVRKLLDSLGVEDVAVVITTRSLGRTLPSLWQQHIRNGRSTTFESYLAGLAAQRERGQEHIETDPDAHIWRAFLLNGLVRRWSEAGAREVNLVTTPGRPRHLLWDRFVAAIGLPDLANAPELTDLDRPSHAGLTAPETLVLASVNAALTSGSWSGRDADRLRELVIQGFHARGERGGQIVLPPDWRPKVAEWSRADLAELRGMAVRVTGDIDDLRYDPDSEKAAAPTPEEIGLAGAAAIVAIANTKPGESTIHRKARHLWRLLRKT